MKFILVLEDDLRLQKELFDTLKSIDPQLQARFFKDLAEFHEWLKLVINDGPLALAKAGKAFPSDNAAAAVLPASDHELRLVIAKNEFLGTQNMNLVRRARDFFIRKNLCPSTEPTSLVLTAFDSPQFDIVLAEERIINNVIFKPFDKLILKQHLEFAIGGRHPMDGSTISAIQINAQVEMLKRTEFESLNEIGFRTWNNHDIPLGAMTKYYAEVFHTDTRRSVYAFCTACTPQAEHKFLCEFRFFAADNAQIARVRKEILLQPKHQEIALPTPGTDEKKWLILDEDEAQGLELKKILQEKFPRAQISQYSSHAQLLSDLADKETTRRQILPLNFDGLFIALPLIADDRDKNAEQLHQFLKDRMKRHGREWQAPSLFLTTKSRLSAEETRKYYGLAEDIFFFPLDRAYLGKKLAARFPQMPTTTPQSLTQALPKEALKIANTVDITQISEAGLVMKYYRAIALGSFRDFILVRENEHESPEITATCNFSESRKGSTPPAHDNHFIFFGMRDHFLKHIRLWLRESYIKQKGDE